MSLKDSKTEGNLKDAFAGDLHALALKTYTPEKWASAQD